MRIDDSALAKVRKLKQSDDLKVIKLSNIVGHFNLAIGIRVSLWIEVSSMLQLISKRASICPFPTAQPMTLWPIEIKRDIR